MNLQEILSVKGTAVHTIGPEATLQDVLRTLVERRIGCLIVCLASRTEQDALLGIVTERDILHACVADTRPLNEVRVTDAMSTSLITGTPEDEVEFVMGLMTTRRIRHLPVIYDGRLAGIISIGDVVKAQHDRLALENRFMKDYIGH